MRLREIEVWLRFLVGRIQWEAKGKRGAVCHSMVVVMGQGASTQHKVNAYRGWLL